MVNKNEKGFAKALASQIQRIKLQGKTREQDYYKKYKTRVKNNQEVLSQSEKKTITSPKEYKEYKSKVEQASKFNPIVDRFKTKVYTGASKIETGVHTVLENVTSKIGRAMNQRVISRGIVRANKSTIVVKEPPKNEYVPIYFQAELNNAKKQMFFD